MFDEMFDRELEELGIPKEEFPFDFAAGQQISWPPVIEALMWILKKRQDKMLEQLQNA